MSVCYDRVIPTILTVIGRSQNACKSGRGVAQLRHQTQLNAEATTIHGCGYVYRWQYTVTPEHCHRRDWRGD